MLRPMNAVASIALSGMNAAQTALGVAGHNIANAATAGFRRQQVVQADTAAGGVATTLRQLPAEGPLLATDLVGQLQAKNGFLASLAVFRSSDRMMGALLDATT